MRDLKCQTILHSIDPLWLAVRDGAEQIRKAEPSLSSFVESTILNHDRLEDALIFRLATRLDHADVSAFRIREAFGMALENNPEIGEAMRVDLAATIERDPAVERAVVPILYFKGFHALQTHRFANSLQIEGRRDFALYLQSRSSQVFQVDINPAVKIGRGIMFDHGTGIVIGETATIGDNTSVLQGVTLGGTGKESGDRHPKVGADVLIGAGAKILGNIKIGRGARVAAGSVVLKDVPAHKTVAGVPAKIVGSSGCSKPGCDMDQMLASTEKT